MTVSVILPTRNRLDLLARALSSIDAQTYLDYEVIVVNDGGEDCAAVVAQHNNAIYLAHDRQAGCGAARNTAALAARGEYIAYLDDDDQWYPCHLSTLVQAIGGEFRVAYSDALWVDESGIQTGMSMNFDRAVLARMNITPVICVLHERSLFEQCGYFDESLASHEDYDLWLRFARVTAFRHVPRGTCEYWLRNDPGRMSRYCDMVADRAKVQARYA